MATTHTRLNRDNYANWLIQQMHRDDAVGEVACAVEADSCLPSTNYHAIARHAEHDHRASHRTLDALKRAFEEWTQRGVPERERRRLEKWSLDRYGLTPAELDCAAMKLRQAKEDTADPYSG